MAARFPLIANSSANQIQELASGDDMNLTGSSITGAGIITATKLAGNEITAVGGVDATGGLKAAGIVSFTNATDSTSSTTGAVVISGGVGIAKSLFVGNNVTIGGTVTYEDVTNVDSVGLVTARAGVIINGGRGLQVTAGGLNVDAGIGTFDVGVKVVGGDGVQVTAGGLNVDAGIGTFDAGVNVGSNKAITLGTGATVTSPATNTLTVGTASTEVVRVNANAGILLNNGILVERVKIDSDSLNSDKFIRLQDGMVHYRSSAVGAANVKPDIVSTTGINTDLAIGDSIAVTIITVAGNASHFVDSIAIDGKNTGITTNWVGGSAPTAGGASAVDTYAFNILKTASETYTVVANHVKCSA
tara:strand:+ start:261 stop:1337 length:1077 start_codon:yes stop_codon:yes gene_type:complete